MTPILAGLLPLLTTLGLALTTLVVVGALSYWMLVRVAAGEFEPEEQEEPWN